MAYVPKKRRITWTWKTIVPCILVLAMLGGYAIYSSSSHSNLPEKFTICNYNSDKTMATLQNTYEQTYTISDYLYYGESLNLYTNDYSLEGKEYLSRKTIELYNVCTKETFSFTMEANLDRQIALEELTQGYYEVFVIDNLEKKRLVFDEAVEANRFTTILRNETSKQIQVIADADLLSAYDVTLNHNYLFLQVDEETIAESNDVDIVIDPYGSFINAVGVKDIGVQGNDLVEAKETYDAALILKEKLESYGLRVMLTRKSADEVVPYYGEDGRYARAYKAHARYYIEIGMNVSAYDTIKGTSIYHSTYASDTLGGALMYQLKKNTSLIPSTQFQWGDRNPGVGTAGLVEDEQKLKIYDGLNTIRETGGLATGAGKISQAAQANKAIASTTREGMMALSLNFVYVSNEDDASYWKANKELIMEETANALVKSLHVAEFE